MKLGIIITSYNRPEYLNHCLESIERADLSQVSIIMIVDDSSTDTETKKLVDDFDLKGVELIKAYSKENRSIKGSLLFGCDVLFNTCDLIINLDGDAIVSQDFVSVLLKLKEAHLPNIITGFNCQTKNLNGSERHPIISAGDGYNLKKSVGGVNMLFDVVQYSNYIKPALEYCIAYGGNWDALSCLNSMKDNLVIVCSVPSVVQHIGIKSSMGHSTGGEPPDVADDFIYSYTADRIKLDIDIWGHAKLQLPQVTLIGVDCVNIDRLIKSADWACRGIEFGAVKLLSSLESNDKRVKKIWHLANKSAYSVFMMKELSNYFRTTHVLVIQYDGTVLNPDAWRDEWLQYDYIGAPWDWYTDGKNVGNGGFSLRTFKLQKIVKSDPAIVPVNEPGITAHKEEDHCICRVYRKYLEGVHGIKYAPIEEARKFSIEGWNSPNKVWTNEFGFHGHTADISKSKFTI